jgi:hypothetical protein
VDSAERAVHGERDRPLHRRSPLRDEHAADVQGVRLLRRRRAPLDVIDRIAGMAVEPDDQVAGGSSNTRVQPGRYPTVGVREDHAVETVLLRGGREHLDGVVRGCSVSHEELDLAVEVLGRNIGYERRDVLGLVPHWSDDRDPPDRVALGLLGKLVHPSRFRLHGSATVA